MTHSKYLLIRSEADIITAATESQTNDVLFVLLIQNTIT